jgi:hypothetical protein
MVTNYPGGKVVKRLNSKFAINLLLLMGLCAGFSLHAEPPVDVALVLIRVEFEQPSDDKTPNDKLEELRYSSRYYKELTRNLAAISADRSPFKQVPLLSKISKSDFEFKPSPENGPQEKRPAPIRLIEPSISFSRKTGRYSVVFGLLFQDPHKASELHKELEKMGFHTQNEKGDLGGSWRWQLDKVQYGVTIETMRELEALNKEKAEKSLFREKP